MVTWRVCSTSLKKPMSLSHRNHPTTIQPSWQQTAATQGWSKSCLILYLVGAIYIYRGKHIYIFDYTKLNLMIGSCGKFVRNWALVTFPPALVFGLTGLLSLKSCQLHVWGETCWTGCWQRPASRVTWMWSGCWCRAMMPMPRTVPSTVMSLLSSLGCLCMLLHEQVRKHAH